MFTDTGNIFVQPFTPPAGLARGQAILEFENQHDLDVVRSHNEYGPFVGSNTWLLAKWLMHPTMTSEAREEFFKLPIVSGCSLFIHFMSNSSGILTGSPTS